MNGLPPLLTVALPLAGVVVGALLQYCFNHFTERRKELRRLRSEAYVAHLHCVSESPRGDDGARVELLTKLTEAKTRIRVYGSTKVINALANFEVGGARITTPAQKNLFLHIIQAMRIDSAGVRHTKLENIKKIFLGTELSQADTNEAR
jgi:hypothetical protein